MSNVLTIRKIIIWLFIKLLLPPLGTLKVMGMLMGTVITRATATIVIRGVVFKTIITTKMLFIHYIVSAGLL